VRIDAEEGDVVCVRCTLVVEEGEEDVLGEEEEAQAHQQLPPLGVQQRVVQVRCTPIFLHY
jgi:transcription initiation factor TFIIIB Brf1 subunit/transcription initiation factor TFIIB